MANLQERALALAGIFQAACLVQQLAREGRAAPEPFRTSIHSILMLDANNTAEVYGGVQGVAFGLKLLSEKLTDTASPKDLEVAKYAIGTVQLEAALRRRPEIAEAIRTGVGTIESQMAFFEPEENGAVHLRLLDKLAELYTQTLSTISPRIMVNGEQGFLANPHLATSVRAALFAGVRSAVLWRQLGGSRWQLLLSRNKIAADAEQLLKHPIG